MVNLPVQDDKDEDSLKLKESLLELNGAAEALEKEGKKLADDLQDATDKQKIKNILDNVS